MDVLDKMVNLGVHQSRLSQLWDLTRTKLEYPLVCGVPRIDPATWNYSATRESRNILARSALPSSAMSSLTT
jgi:hypothetical protein